MKKARKLTESDALAAVLMMAHIPKRYYPDGPCCEKYAARIIKILNGLDLAHARYTAKVLIAVLINDGRIIDVGTLKKISKLKIVGQKPKPRNQK